MVEPTDQIIIYQLPDGETSIDVKMGLDTVWLTLEQLASLFERDKSTISRHLANIFQTNELLRDSTVAKNATVQKEGSRTVNRTLEYFNLDAIISVGYRVNSKRGTQFRLWANRILKEYLIRGYAIDNKNLEAKTGQLEDLQRTIALMHQLTSSKTLNAEETSGLLKVVTDYSYALDILDRYDHQTLQVDSISEKEVYVLSYPEAISAIQDLKKQYGGSQLFGNEKDESFRSSLATIYQTYTGQDLYPSVQEKAANLLYFITKNHSFSDGNKRIAASLFLLFMDRNASLYRPDGSKRIADNALVALTLMIAESKPQEKDLMIKVLINLINFKN